MGRDVKLESLKPYGREREEHPTSCSSKKVIPHQFSSGWENLRNTSIKKSKYDPQTMKDYFIHIENQVYTSTK